MALSTVSGLELHPIGIGTWNIGSRIDPTAPQGTYRNIVADYDNEAAEIEGLHYSLSKGQNHIDTAELYGAFHTDEVVGKALADHKTQREDLFIADKLWSNSVAPGAVNATVEKMLNKLQTGYLDMLYIHAPWTGVDWTPAVAQINELIDEGLVRYFAVSNFSVSDMEKAIDLSSYPLAANQMYFNCGFRKEVDEDFKSFCADNNVAIVAYQPVDRGEILTSPALIEVAGLHDATPAQIAIAWLLHQDALPIPKAIQKQHIDENLGALDIKLSHDDLAKINTM